MQKNESGKETKSQLRNASAISSLRKIQTTEDLDIAVQETRNDYKVE